MLLNKKKFKLISKIKTNRSFFFREISLLTILANSEWMLVNGEYHRRFPIDALPEVIRVTDVIESPKNLQNESCVVDLNVIPNVQNIEQNSLTYSYILPNNREIFVNESDFARRIHARIKQDYLTANKELMPFQKNQEKSEKELYVFKLFFDKYYNFRLSSLFLYNFFDSFVCAIKRFCGSSQSEPERSFGALQSKCLNFINISEDLHKNIIGYSLKDIRDSGLMLINKGGVDSENALLAGNTGRDSVLLMSRAFRRIILGNLAPENLDKPRSLEYILTSFKNKYFAREIAYGVSTFTRSRIEDKASSGVEQSLFNFLVFLRSGDSLLFFTENQRVAILNCINSLNDSDFDEYAPDKKISINSLKANANEYSKIKIESLQNKSGLKNFCMPSSLINLPILSKNENQIGDDDGALVLELLKDLKSKQIDVFQSREAFFSEYVKICDDKNFLITQKKTILISEYNEIDYDKAGQEGATAQQRQEIFDRALTYYEKSFEMNCFLKETYNAFLKSESSKAFEDYLNSVYPKNSEKNAKIKNFMDRYDSFVKSTVPEKLNENSILEIPRNKFEGFEKISNFYGNFLVAMVENPMKVQASVFMVQFGVRALFASI